MMPAIRIRVPKERRDAKRCARQLRTTEARMTREIPQYVPRVKRGKVCQMAKGEIAI